MMIASLRGTVVEKDHQSAVVECGGVGYGLAMSLSALARLPPVGQGTFVWVHTHLSQDALRLFGFLEAAEREAFLVLVGTTGVGPRLALAILSALSPTELCSAVAQQNKVQLCAIPGVGKKKAERLLLELKDRLPQGATDKAMPGPSGLRQDLHSALCNLGFTPQIADRAARQAMEQAPEQTDLTALLREALRQTTARPPS